MQVWLTFQILFTSTFQEGRPYKTAIIPFNLQHSPEQNQKNKAHQKDR
jgi:hypothetical protein